MLMSRSGTVGNAVLPICPIFNEIRVALNSSPYTLLLTYPDCFGLLVEASSIATGFRCNGLYLVTEDDETIHWRNDHLGNMQKAEKREKYGSQSLMRSLFFLLLLRHLQLSLKSRNWGVIHQRGTVFLEGVVGNIDSL